MRKPTPHFAIELMSGQARGPHAALLRGAMRLAAPLYAAATTLRNTLYDSGLLPSHRLRVPVISVGNITTGGTGKTPAVRWLAERLCRLGMHPAVLMRGYKRDQANISDEQMLLEGYLNSGDHPPVVVHAQADRVAGGNRVLAEHPEVDVFVLDDGFQHRRLRRDFDLVLIDATNPFGYGHVLPRGLLRERLTGLRRADAFVLTRSDQVPTHQLTELEAILRMWNPLAPAYRARHAHTGLRSAAGTDIPLDRLAHQRFFAFAGIAQPQSLDHQLFRFGPTYCGHHWFADHHDYSEQDLNAMRRQAQAAGAQAIVVTEKDWAKIQRYKAAQDDSIPIWRLEVQIALDEKAEIGLLELIETRIDKAKAMC